MSKKKQKKNKKYNETITTGTYKSLGTTPETERVPVNAAFPPLSFIFNSGGIEKPGEAALKDQISSGGLQRPEKLSDLSEITRASK